VVVKAAPAVETSEISAVITLFIAIFAAPTRLALTVLEVGLSVGVKPVSVSVGTRRRGTEAASAVISTILLTINRFQKLARKASKAFRTYTTFEIFILALSIVHAKEGLWLSVDDTFKADRCRRELAESTIEVYAITYRIIGFKAVATPPIHRRHSILLEATAPIEAFKAPTIFDFSLAQGAAVPGGTITVLPILVIVRVEPVSMEIGLTRGCSKDALAIVLALESTILAFNEFTRETSISLGANTSLGVVRLTLTIVHAEKYFVAFHVVKADAGRGELAVPTVIVDTLRLVAGGKAVTTIRDLSINLINNALTAVETGKVITGIVAFNFTKPATELSVALAKLEIVMILRAQINLIRGAVLRRLADLALPIEALEGTILLLHILALGPHRVVWTSAGSTGILGVALTAIGAKIIIPGQSTCTKFSHGVLAVFAGKKSHIEWNIAGFTVTVRFRFPTCVRSCPASSTIEAFDTSTGRSFDFT